MKQGVRSKTDPMEREIELALRPGVFIGYREGFSFVTQIEELAAQIHKLVATEPGRALGLSETFLAGCHAKADELDDSDGSFGQFAHKLICLWIAPAFVISLTTLGLSGLDTLQRSAAATLIFMLQLRAPNWLDLKVTA
jgi:hypothetical protein